MAFNFLGGLANGYQGFQQGADDEVARQRSAAAEVRREAADTQLVKDQAYQQTQREYNQGQQARTLREQGITDSINDKNKAVPQTREVEVSPGLAASMPQLDNEGTPSSAALPATRSIQRTNWEMSGDMARNFREAGRHADAETHQTAYEQGGAKHSAKLFAQIDAASAGMSPLELVKSVASVYSNDPYAGQIDNIEQSTPDGPISFTVTNKTTGESTRKSFKDASQIMNNLRSYYSPEMQAKVAEATQKAAVEARKNIILPKDSLLVNNNTGKTVATGTTSFTEEAGDGTTGSKGGKKGSNPAADLQKQVADLVHKDNPNPAEAVSYAMELLRLKPDMVPATAARLAVGQQNGAKTRMVSDPKTGLFNQVIDDFGTPDAKGKLTNRGTGGTYLLSSSEYAPGGMVSKEEAAKAATAIMAAAPKEQAEGFLATQTPEGYAAYNASLKTKTDAAWAKLKSDLAVAKTPAEQAELEADFNTWLKPLDNDVRRMELVRSHYTPPKAAASPAPAAPLIKQVGGMFNTPSYTPIANSDASRMQAERQRAQQEQQTKQAANQSRDNADRTRIATDVSAAIQIQDPTVRRDAMSRLQQSPAFGLLDDATKSIVFRVVNGR